MVDEFLLGRLDDARSPVPSVTRALGRLRETAGRVPVGALAAEIGCSHRHLIAQFRDQVGVPPKLLGRILRFEHVISLVDSRTEMGWAEIGQVCGYYDQAHLIRDFNQFAGSPPGDFARRRLPDGGASSATDPHRPAIPLPPHRHVIPYGGEWCLGGIAPLSGGREASEDCAANADCSRVASRRRLQSSGARP